MIIQITKATEKEIFQVDSVIVNTWLKTYCKMLQLSEKEVRNFFGSVTKRIEGIKSGLQQKSVLILLARSNKKVAGVCFGYTQEDFSVIKGLYVLPEYQGKGIGSRLLKEFEKRMSLPVKLNVLHQNLSAQTFYKSNGYVYAKKYSYFSINKKRFRDDLYIKYEN